MKSSGCLYPSPLLPGRPERKELRAAVAADRLRRAMPFIRSSTRTIRFAVRLMSISIARASRAQSSITLGDPVGTAIGQAVTHEVHRPALARADRLQQRVTEFHADASAGGVRSFETVLSVFDRSVRRLMR